MPAKNDNNVLYFKKGTLLQNDLSDDNEHLNSENMRGRAETNVRRLKQVAHKQRGDLRVMRTQLSRVAKQRERALLVAHHLRDALRSRSSELGVVKATFRVTTRRLSILAATLSFSAAGYAISQLLLTK